MTQEEKELLLKDLSARLTYGVIINVHDTFPCTILPYFNIRLNSFVSILSFTEPIFKTKDKLIKRILKEHTEYLEFKPYLRPMSSMTEEEFLEYHNIKYNKITYRDKWKRIDVGKFHNIGIIPIEDYLDWLNAHHFDYRGLIEKGLALEAKEGMY